MILKIAVIIGIFILFCTLYTKNSGVHIFRRSAAKRAELKGERGELIVHNELCDLPEEYRLLDDVMLRTKNGTTQIDHIVVSKYGVFAIETKNYRGSIYGNDNGKEWTQIIETPVQFKRFGKVYTYIKKSKFYNPVKQAEGHVRAIKKLLSAYPHLPIIPIVAFSGEADIDDIESDVKIVYFRDLVEEILSYKNIFIRDENVDKVVDILLARNVSGEVSKTEHIRSIYHTKYEYEDKIDNNICPWCGGELVQREGKYGRFYGCANYPKCKFKTK